MIANKNLPPIHIHPILGLFFAISFLTGTLTELVIIFLIVLIHELGHYMAAAKFRWRIDRISLWVFGGVMETEEHGNRSIKEECLVTIAGPLQHLWIYIIMIILTSVATLPSSVTTLIFQYNTTILLFNLLPIWPLDGGKLLFACLSAVLPYKQAHSMTIIVSVVSCSIGLVYSLYFYSFTLSIVMLAGFILWENRIEWKQRYYVFLRFLLKRYSEPQTKIKTRPLVVSPDTSLLHVFSKFRRNYLHCISINHYSTTVKSAGEKEFLDAYFGLRQYRATAGELLGHIKKE